MDRNIRLLIAYDGTDFHGWQRQTDLRTVQGLIEQAARRVARHQVVLIGAGRTDAGVHAAGQVANFLTTCKIPTYNLLRAIGSRLPKDVTLIHTDEVPLNFHSTRAAVRKLYRYTIHNRFGRPVAFLRQRYSYHFWHPLAVERMRDAARAFVGIQDFAAMASRGETRETTVRTVYACNVYRHYDEIRIDVEGRGFLYNQVRNMVGTLIEIGRGHWAVDCIPDILATKDRRNAGPTAPARGLSLQWVQYELDRLPPADAWWPRRQTTAPENAEPDADAVADS
ncbi:MAG: tRNA pseudouridine(38-40) synthase TruA [Phycisphaerae bacterium]|nr:tRNA pseudouridine(38-40) synthase TruA [Phycisphaerae bacterium]